MSAMPCSCALKSLILALRDSAEALVARLLKTEDIHPPKTGISAKASYNTSGCLQYESIPKFFLSFTYFPTKIFYLMCEITKIITPLFADGKLDTIG